MIAKYVLGIQTAEFPNSIALCKGNGVVVQVVKITGREKTVERLGKLFKQLFDEENLQPQDIGLVTVCIGPGSYTGTRGGVAFAKGFCQFKNIPLVGISSFEVLAEGIRNIGDKGIKQGNIFFMLDARSGRVFYRKESEVKIKVGNITDIVKNVQAKSFFVGSGAEVYKDMIKVHLKEKAVFVEGVLNFLHAAQVAKLGIVKFNANSSNFTKDNLYKIKPLYILLPNITRSKK